MSEELVTRPPDAADAYRAQLELLDELCIPSEISDRKVMANLAISAAQECRALADVARDQDDELNAELHQQNAKNIFGDVVRMSCGDMRAALYARYPNLAEDAAQDVLQEAYLKAYRFFHRFHHRSSFHTWMYRVTMNEAKKRFRKFKSSEDDAVVDDMSPYEERKHASVAAAEYDGDKKQLLMELLAELKPEVREMIWLAHVEQYSYPEIAEMLSRRLGIKRTPGAVKVRVHRAMNDLREKVKARDLSIDDVID